MRVGRRYPRSVDVICQGSTRPGNSVPACGPRVGCVASALRTGPVVRLLSLAALAITDRGILVPAGPACNPGNPGMDHFLQR